MAIDYMASHLSLHWTLPGTTTICPFVAIQLMSHVYDKALVEAVKKLEEAASPTGGNTEENHEKKHEELPLWIAMKRAYDATYPEPVFSHNPDTVLESEGGSGILSDHKGMAREIEALVDYVLPEDLFPLDKDPFLAGMAIERRRLRLELLEHAKRASAATFEEVDRFTPPALGPVVGSGYSA
jgi:hypothetical protein